MDSSANQDSVLQSAHAANMEHIRAEMEWVCQVARDRVAARLQGSHTEALTHSRNRVQELARAGRTKARDRIKAVGNAGKSILPTPTKDGTDLALHDLHMLERLCSYVRHSIVRVCFYNLKLFCPSLIDEYDVEVRGQILTNIGQLDVAQAEIVQFFEQPVSNGKKIREVFGQAYIDALRPLDALIRLAAMTRNGLDNEPVRRDFAQNAPDFIDAVMAGLQDVQTGLDLRKIHIGESVELAISLAKALTEQAGLAVEFRIKPSPVIFGNRHHLVDAFLELIRNAVKYSRGSRLEVAVEPLDSDLQRLQVSFSDNGQGMTSEELATCLQRGVSRDGTGEGLPMVVQIIEEEHLGEFEITATPGKGCQAIGRLPLKLNAGRRRN